MKRDLDSGEKGEEVPSKRAGNVSASSSSTNALIAISTSRNATVVSSEKIESLCKLLRDTPTSLTKYCSSILEKQDYSVYLLNEALLESCSVEGEYDAFIAFLLDMGAKVDAVSSHRSPLILATSLGKCSTVSLLLDRNANVDAVNADGKTGLMYACACGNIAIVELLLAKGANIHAVNVKGKTALMYACVRGKIAIVEFLLSKGANTDGALLHTLKHYFHVSNLVFDIALLLVQHGAVWDIDDAELVNAAVARRLSDEQQLQLTEARSWCINPGLK